MWRRAFEYANSRGRSKNMLRVLLASGLPPPEYGGIINWSRVVRRELGKRSDVELAFVNTTRPHQDARRLQTAGRLVFGSYQAILVVCRMCYRMWADRPDVVHLNTTPSRHVPRHPHSSLRQMAGDSQRDPPPHATTAGRNVPSQPPLENVAMGLVVGQCCRGLGQAVGKLRSGRSAASEDRDPSDHGGNGRNRQPFAHMQTLPPRPTPPPGLYLWVSSALSKACGSCCKPVWN